MKIWVIEPSTGTLHDVTDGGTLRVFEGDDPYGVCTYRSAPTGKCYFFVTGKYGEVEQVRLEDAGNGKVKIAGDRWIVDTQWSPRGRLER